MEYTSDICTVNKFESDISNKVNAPDFNNDIWSIPTRMHYCMLMIAEVDRLTKLLQILPQVQQYKAQNYIDQLNTAVKKLSIDVPHTEQFSEVKEIDNSHPYIKLMNSFKNKGFDFDRALDMTAGNVGVSSLTLTKFLEDNGITRDKYIKLDNNAYNAGIDAAKFNKTVDEMYDKAKPYLHDAKCYLSFIKGFSSIANFSEDIVNSEILKDYIVNYSESFDSDLRTKIIKMSK